MHDHTLIITSLFVGFLLVLTTLLKGVSKRTNFPYTIAILLAGFGAQLGLGLTGVEFDFSLSPDFIFFVLLPLLLFESASNVNSHQFKLQFRTITFLATFGLLLSVGIVGVLLAWLLELPLGVALLFGAIISATDPIAVLSIFKSLGAPKRLAMLAEGESMFNDATAVILFRILGTIVVAQHSFGSETLFTGLGTFLYVFFGSLIAGSAMGWFTSAIIERVENDRIIETTLTVALALLSFGITEHFFGLSGVISTVAAGITLSALGKTRISGEVAAFMHEFWEYIGFLAISLVFFFSAFSLDVLLLFRNPVELVVVIGAVLLARSVSVYASFGLSNRLPWFNQEPNVPLSWQNVLNWGGLRGVIPLVLVYSLPETFIFKELLVAYTLVVFVYSLLVHGLSVKSLLKKLKLDRPQHESLIAKEEIELLELEDSLDRLDALSPHEFDPDMVHSFRLQLVREAEKHQHQLQLLATGQELEKSLKLQAVSIERETVSALFRLGHVTETTVLEYEAELDLQQDALQYPEVAKGRGYKEGGKIQTQLFFTRRMSFLKKNIQRLPWLTSIFKDSKKRLIEQRIQLLRARLVASNEVTRYLDYITHFFGQNQTAVDHIHQVKGQYLKYSKDNQRELKQLEERYPIVYRQYQQKTLRHVVLG